MTIATAWAALAKQENAAYRKKWGTGLQQQKKEQPKPKQGATRQTVCQTQSTPRWAKLAP